MNVINLEEITVYQEYTIFWRMNKSQPWTDTTELSIDYWLRKQGSLKSICTWSTFMCSCYLFLIFTYMYIADLMYGDLETWDA